MAQKDYVSRGQTNSRRKKSNKKQHNLSKVSPTLIIMAIALLISFIGGLYFITHHNAKNMPLSPAHNNQPANSLPPKPEERWRYIKELENRQVGIPNPTEPNAGANTNSPVQLTDEQRQLLAQMQADMQKQPIQLPDVPYNEQPTTQTLPQTTPSGNPFNNNSTNSAPNPIAQPAKTARNSEAHTQNTAPIQQEKNNSLAAKTEKKQRWIVQCGSFHSLEQANSVRAQLAFAGIESKVISSKGWNRVLLGPYDNKATTEKALTRLKNANMPNCIPLADGG